MELKYLRPLIALGVPGVGLGIFYLLLRGFKFEFSTIPPIFSGIIAIVFLVVITIITIFALHRFAPKQLDKPTHSIDETGAKAQQTKSDLFRVRDIESIKFILNEISFVALDNFIDDARSCNLDLEILYFYEGYKAITTSNTFHLHDHGAEYQIATFLRTWNIVMEYGNHFMPTTHVMRYRLPKPHEVPTGTDLDTMRTNFLNAIEEMASSLKTMTQYLKENYPEINLHETSQNAWSRYIEHGRESKSDLAEIQKS